MIYRGEPSDNAVMASREVVLSNETHLVEEDFSQGEPINSSNFYAQRLGPAGYYNTIRVEVVVWRI
jgi:hypothetical protein